MPANNRREKRVPEKKPGGGTDKSLVPPQIPLRNHLTAAILTGIVTHFLTGIDIVPTPLPPPLLGAASSAPLALAYTAGLLLALRFPAATRLAAPFSATGQMALTNYLAQSLVQASCSTATGWAYTADSGRRRRPGSAW